MVIRHPFAQRVLGRTLSVADALRFVKSNSSNWIHNEFKHLQDFHWQEGYGAFAVSHSNIADVKKYLANQETHHRSMTYQDELRQILTQHDIQWDERYVWD